MKKLFIAALILPLLYLSSCHKKDDAAPHLFTGSNVKIGNGAAHAWIETDEQNHPKSAGITFDQSAFSNLPATDGNEYILSLPADKLGLPFDHIGLNWNPHGHPPEHVYDKPHFDVHFYMIDEHAQMGIPAFETDSTGFLNYPAPGYLPANYVPIPGGEPMMGAHWVDLTSPELNQSAPQPFTQTFIFGSFGGQVIFYEPMITLDFLTKTQTFTRDIPQPQKFGKDGYYPTIMSITHADGSVNITLSGYVFRSRS